MNRRISKRRLMGEINVVPYIDVMLVLLVIFMITAPLLQRGITVDLPEAAAPPLDEDLLAENEPLILSIDADGQFYLNIGDDPDQPIDADVVLARASAVLRQAPETAVIINGDEAVPYGRVAEGLDLMQRAGAKRQSLLMDSLQRSETP